MIICSQQHNTLTSLYTFISIVAVSDVYNASNVFGGELKSMAYTVREPIIRGIVQHYSVCIIFYLLLQEYLQLERHMVMLKGI